MSKIDAIIPLVPQHTKYLKNLLDNLDLQTVTFANIIIVASGFTKDISILKSFESGKIHIVYNDLASAGANRNFGIELAYSELISFLDADDLYHPMRNEYIFKNEKSSNFDLLLHSYVFFKDNIHFENIDYYNNTKQIFDHNYFIKAKTCEGRARDIEVTNKFKNANLNFLTNSDSFPVHHAHVVVKTRILDNIKFHENPYVRNEDGVFCRDVLCSGYKLFATSAILSGYRLNSGFVQKESLLTNLYHKVKRKLI